MKLFIRLILFILVAIGSVYLFRSFVAAPADFPVPYQLSIERGQTLFSISTELAEAHVIKSRRLFEIFMIAFGSEKNISEGEYYFASPASSLSIALRISGKQFGIERVKVTFPEGFTTKQMAERLATSFTGFDTTVFMTLTKGQEGYLFPDTYRFFPSATPDVIVSTLKRNFDTKVEPLRRDIGVSGRSEKDIIIMASIIEKEAAGEADRTTISGILWKRLDQGIALQVDAPFLYILGKESKELTVKDLAINSPYNTYKHTGLPPTAIGNPGLAAITAAVHPVESPYLYYLHDADGGIHYAKTYAEHKANIAKYLR